MFCRNKRIIAAAVIVACCSAAAQAQQTPAEQVRQINEEIAVLSAKLQKLEIEAKIAGKTAEVQKAETANGSVGMFGGASDEMPLVRAIDGMDGKLVATLVMRGGAVQTVREGERFGVWTIKAITVNAVVIGRGKEIVRLHFGNEPSSGSGLAATNNPGQQPYFPR